MNQPEVMAALVTGFVALLTAIVSLMVTLYRLYTEQRRWEKDFQRLETRWEQELRSKLGSAEMEVQRDLVAARRESYSEIFAILGQISDVERVTSEDDIDTLDGRVQRARDIADQLAEHLYGHAGLLMEMNTRNALHRVWLACQLFPSEVFRWQQLQGYFFIARRQLRADLGIRDVDEIPSATDNIWTKHGLAKPEAHIAALREMAKEQGVSILDLPDVVLSYYRG